MDFLGHQDVETTWGFWVLLRVSRLLFFNCYIFSVFYDEVFFIYFYFLVYSFSMWSLVLLFDCVKRKKMHCNVLRCFLSCPMNHSQHRVCISLWQSYIINAMWFNNWMSICPLTPKSYRSETLCWKWDFNHPPLTKSSCENLFQL